MSGRATAEKTTDASVTMTGSTVVISTPAPKERPGDQDGVEPVASCGRTNFPRQHPADREPDEDVQPHHSQVFLVQCSSTPPEEKKSTS